ncbi:MAG: hypothetical protein IJT72_10470 [Lachnospiraceae bacterium]|nr:hypothetical protein [Lachnospiraceae bacterium]
MKKLFLYIGLLVSVFCISYFIASALYRHSRKQRNINEEVILTDETQEDYEVADSEIFSYGYNTKEAQSVNSFINKTDNDNSNDKYILGILDGYVIVYLNDMDTIYEFTDIDAGVLKILDKEQYEKIKNNITFNSLEELFDFLESVSS